MTKGARISGAKSLKRRETKRGDSNFWHVFVLDQKARDEKSCRDFDSPEEKRPGNTRAS